jgi:hypothetical protein
MVHTVSGVFADRHGAEHAVHHLLALGVPDRQIACVSPDAPSATLTDAVPTVEAEQPGVGRVLGAVVCGAAGATAGVPLRLGGRPGVPSGAGREIRPP